jgi:hypothetical protein
MHARRLACHWRRQRLWVSDNDRSHGPHSRVELNGPLAFGRLQIVFGKADPTRAETHRTCGQHEILSRKRTVLDDPSFVGLPRYHDECRRMIEDLIGWIAQ